MTIQTMLDRIFVALDTGQGVHELMRADERAAGHSVILPGDEPWLSADDWHPTVVVSRDGDVVRLIAILALNPGHGALRRTVAGIQAAGLTPCIIEPTREMRATLQRWNWKCKRVGHGLEAEERWRPRRSKAPSSAQPIAETPNSVEGVNNKD